jgi:hypothetical protein
MWWSHRIGGYNALDYLVKVKGISFTQTVEMLIGKAAVMPTSTAIKPKADVPKVLLLPDKSASADKERLADIQERIQEENVQYEPAHNIHKTVSEIENMGQKTLTGKIAVSKDDYQQSTALATEGITSL